MQTNSWKMRIISNLKSLKDKIKSHFSRWALYWVLLGVLAVLAITVLVVVFAFTGWPHLRSPFAGKEAVRLTPDSKALATDEMSKKLASRILPFARVSEFNETLFLPARMGLIKGIGYHESGNNKAYSLEPIGKLIKNENDWKVDVPLGSNCAAPQYYIMESRGESTTATSVADIAMERNTPVLAPIDGTVTKVESLVIYDEYEDIQIEIMPAGHPELRMAFLHIDDIRIKVGDEVKQGQTMMGIPRDFTAAFKSELDDYIKPPFPHVHMQMNRYVPDQPD